MNTRWKSSQLSLVIGSMCGALLLLMGLTEQLTSLTQGIPTLVMWLLWGILINGVFAAVYHTVSQRISTEGIDFTALLWQVVMTVLICTFGSGIINVIQLLLKPVALPWYLATQASFFHIEYFLMVYFLAFTFTVWKRMILYDQTRIAQKAWKVFEIMLLFTALSHFVEIPFLGIVFNISLTLVGVWVVVVCFNARWIPQLNFDQKLLGIGQLLLLLCCLAFFFGSINSYFYGEYWRANPLFRSIFLIAIFGFVAAYAVFSLLFLLFNLPTTRIIERKFKEIRIFQKLSDSIVEQKNEEGVYVALLQSAMSAAKADAGWLATRDKSIFLKENISEDKIRKINFYLKKSGYEGKSIARINPSSFFKNKSQHEFQSYLALPLNNATGVQKGDLVLLRKVSNAFDKSIESNVKSYVSQAEIAVQNFRLLQQVMESERVKNELAIAKQVQKSLLPKNLLQAEDLSITAISEAATEVGGDYYDVFPFPNGGYAIIIADVAGKGISAAFNMAQMKGIFQTLVREDLSPSQFMTKANAALVGCLDKNVFITSSIYFIDPKKQQVTFSRAGHCPALHVQGKEVAFLESKGLGLGIIRTAQYGSFVEEHAFTYQAGNCMILYTDGIVEARKAGTEEEFSYERLRNFIKESISEDRPHSVIAKDVIENVQAFSGNSSIEDDFTILVVAFLPAPNNQKNSVT